MTRASAETCREMMHGAASPTPPFKHINASNAERSGLGSQSRASFHSHMELSNNALYGKMLIFFVDVAYRTTSAVFFYQIIDIRVEQSRPGPAMTVVDGLLFENIAFFVKLDFCQFFTHFCV